MTAEGDLLFSDEVLDMSFGTPYQPPPPNQPAPLWRPQAPINTAPEAAGRPPGPPPIDETFTPGAWMGDMLFVVTLLGGVLLLTYTLVQPFFSLKEMLGG